VIANINILPVDFENIIELLETIDFYSVIGSSLTVSLSYKR